MPLIKFLLRTDNTVCNNEAFFEDGYVTFGDLATETITLYGPTGVKSHLSLTLLLDADKVCGSSGGIWHCWSWI